MPAPFSAEERARVRGALMQAGRELFTTQGLRKTSLDELVQPAGIAKSSFYAFFDSKEALYLELMLDQMADVKRRVIDKALLAEPDVRAALRTFLHATVDVLATDPLYRRLMSHPEEMDAVVRRLDPGRIAESPENPTAGLAAFVGEKSASGEIVPADPAVIIGVLQAVLLLPMNASRIAEPQRYPEILDLLIDIVSAGLAARRDRSP